MVTGNAEALLDKTEELIDASQQMMDEAEAETAVKKAASKMQTADLYLQSVAGELMEINEGEIDRFQELYLKRQELQIELEENVRQQGRGQQGAAPGGDGVVNADFGKR